MQVVANLERIRETLEKETGKISSMSCWANAAGVDIKDLQKQLQFGWFCQDELLRTTNSLVRFLSKKYRCSGLPMEDLVQVDSFPFYEKMERICILMFMFLYVHRLELLVFCKVWKGLTRKGVLDSQPISITG